MIRHPTESSVSEVISTILAVALVVILAALVAAYAFGMMPNIPITRTLAYSADQPDASTLLITYHGGPDASSLNYATVVVTPSGGGAVTYRNATHSGASNIIITKNVGSIMTVTTASGGLINKDHVIITGHFSNGQDQVVLDMLI
jgi:FlaG/FlaF family flagellin (archaellin)